MLHKFALLIGGVAAVGVIAVAIAGGGLFPTANADNGASSGGLGNQSAAQGPAAQAPAAHVKTIVDKVYIAPTPEPKVVHVQAPTKVADTKPHADRGNQGEPESEASDHEDNESGEHGDRYEQSETGDD